MSMTFGEASNVRNAIQSWMVEVHLNIVPVRNGEYEIEYEIEAILRSRTHRVKDGTYESMEALEKWAKRIPNR